MLAIIEETDGKVATYNTQIQDLTTQLQQAQELAAKAADAIWQFQNADIHYTQEFISNEEVEFALAELGNDAGIYGAAKLVL